MVGTNIAEPVNGWSPFQPPLAVQLVALLVVQLRVVLPPMVTLVGEAVKDTVGAGFDTGASGVTEVDGELLGLVPTLLVAVTVKV